MQKINKTKTKNGQKYPKSCILNVKNIILRTNNELFLDKNWTILETKNTLFLDKNEPFRGQ